MIRSRWLAAAVLGAAIASPAAIADDEPAAIELDHRVFLALKMTAPRYSANPWPGDAVELLRQQVILDGEVSPAEQSVIDQMLAGSFAFTARSATSGVEAAISGSLGDEAKAALRSITAQELQYEVEQRPDETEAAFLLRRNAEGREKLTALVISDPEARRDFSEALADKIQAVYSTDGSSPESRTDTVVDIYDTHAAIVESLEGEAAVTYRRAVRDAAIIGWHTEPRVYSFLGQRFFDDPENYAAESRKIAAELGLPPR